MVWKAPSPWLYPVVAIPVAFLTLLFTAAVIAFYCLMEFGSLNGFRDLPSGSDILNLRKQVALQTAATACLSFVIVLVFRTPFEATWQALAIRTFFLFLGLTVARWSGIFEIAPRPPKK
jgi:hypothetical protein